MLCRAGGLDNFLDGALAAHEKLQSFFLSFFCSIFHFVCVGVS